MTIKAFRRPGALAHFKTIALYAPSHNSKVELELDPGVYADLSYAANLRGKSLEEFINDLLRRVVAVKRRKVV